MKTHPVVGTMHPTLLIEQLRKLLTSPPLEWQRVPLCIPFITQVLLSCILFFHQFSPPACWSDIGDLYLTYAHAQLINAGHIGLLMVCY